MSPELEKNIIKDLEKSGFSSELRAIRTFMSCDWGCTGFANYLDLDEEQIRGVDLRAYKNKEETLSNDIRVGVEYHIEAEVKKSEKPWIVFKEKIGYILDDYNNNLTHISGFPPFKLRNAMAKDSLYTKFGWKAYGIHESFKKPDASARSYSAFITVCKSAEYKLDASSAYYKELEQMAKDANEPMNERVLLLVKPIIVLDGMLLAANLSDTGEISIEEVKFAPLEFLFRSKNCRKGVYLIDIVTLDGLKEYIELSEIRQQTIFDEIKSFADKRAA